MVDILVSSHLSLNILFKVDRGLNELVVSGLNWHISCLFLLSTSWICCFLAYHIIKICWVHWLIEGFSLWWGSLSIYLSSVTTSPGYQLGIFFYLLLYYLWTSDHCKILMWSSFKRSLRTRLCPVLKKRYRSDRNRDLWAPYKVIVIFSRRLVRNCDIFGDPLAVVGFRSVVKTDEFSHVIVDSEGFVVSDWNRVGILEDFPLSDPSFRVYGISLIRRVNSAHNATSKALTSPFFKDFLPTSWSFRLIEGVCTLTITIVWVFGWAMVKHKEWLIVKFEMQWNILIAYCRHSFHVDSLEHTDPFSLGLLLNSLFLHLNCC